MKRGDLYWASLAPRSGSEQRGKRPVIIVSNDVFNEVETWMSVIVVPVSSSPAQARRGPTAVPLPAGSGGLKGNSIALCHQVTTLDRSKFFNRIGSLPGLLLAQVEEGLKNAQDLP